MYYQKEDAPLDEGPVKLLQAMGHKGAPVENILGAKEVAGAEEKDGNVELEDKMIQPRRCAGMGDNHQDDGNCFCDGKRGISHKEGNLQ